MALIEFAIGFWRRKVDCPVTKLFKVKSSPVKQRNQFLLAGLTENNTIRGELAFKPLERFYFPTVGEKGHMAFNVVFARRCPLLSDATVPVSRCATPTTCRCVRFDLRVHAAPSMAASVRFGATNGVWTAFWVRASERP